MQARARLDIAVRQHVLDHHERYKRVGKELDGVYTPEYFFKHPMGRISGESARVTLARTDERIIKVVDELLGYFKARGRTIPSMVEAEKVVLLHWILTDQGCDQESLQATVLQDWSHNAVHHALAHGAEASHIARQAHWEEYVRKAFSVVDPEQSVLLAKVEDRSSSSASDAMATAKRVPVVDEQQAMNSRGAPSSATGRGLSNNDEVADRRSPPLSKSDLARRIHNRAEARPRDVSWDRFDLQPARGVKANLYTVSLKGMDLAMRERVEKSADQSQP
ncbi:MAG: hypothetical protein EA377_08200 [Phycisphaerales bacterium]|nr:MAG: hypothetical protein EA377_08200 [Phycisphaerales bacterium]